MIKHHCEGIESEVFESESPSMFSIQRGFLKSAMYRVNNNFVSFHSYFNHILQSSQLLYLHY